MEEINQGGPSHGHGHGGMGGGIDPSMFAHMFGGGRGGWGWGFEGRRFVLDQNVEQSTVFCPSSKHEHVSGSWEVWGSSHLSWLSSYYTNISYCIKEKKKVKLMFL